MKRNFSCIESSQSRGQATQDYPWTNRDEHNCQLHEPFKNGKAEISPQWSKASEITSSTKSISVRGFTKVAGKSQIRVPAGSVVRINGWQ